MSLVDELLQADAKKADELNTGVYKSKRLQKILGKDEPVEIKIREIRTRRFNDIVATQFDGKGNVDVSSTFDAKIKTIIEGCVEPSMKDKDLQAHFNAKSAADLVEKLFAAEVVDLSEAIESLSVLDEVKEEDLKN